MEASAARTRSAPHLLDDRRYGLGGGGLVGAEKALVGHQIRLIQPHGQRLAQQVLRLLDPPLQRGPFQDRDRIGLVAALKLEGLLDGVSVYVVDLQRRLLDHDPPLPDSKLACVERGLY